MSEETERGATQTLPEETEESPDDEEELVEEVNQYNPEEYTQFSLRCMSETKNEILRWYSTKRWEYPFLKDGADKQQVYEVILHNAITNVTDEEIVERITNIIEEENNTDYEEESDENTHPKEFVQFSFYCKNKTQREIHTWYDMTKWDYPVLEDQSTFKKHVYEAFLREAVDYLEGTETDEIVAEIKRLVIEEQETTEDE